MNATIKISKEVDLAFINVCAEVRYWDDAVLDGEDCTEACEYFPCKEGDCWKPEIDIDNGIILNWDSGHTAKVHFKICDMCAYSIVDGDGETVLYKDWSYVPDILCPGGDGYGDYIIMNIDSDGRIANWNADLILEIFEDE